VGKASIGQLDKTFPRDTQNIYTFINNSSSSKFAQHLNDHIHIFGPIKDTIPIFNYQEKSSHLNTIEWFYIHQVASFDNQLNDKLSSPI